MVPGKMGEVKAEKGMFQTQNPLWEEKMKQRFWDFVLYIWVNSSDVYLGGEPGGGTQVGGGRRMESVYWP